MRGNGTSNKGRQMGKVSVSSAMSNQQRKLLFFFNLFIYLFIYLLLLLLLLLLLFNILKKWSFSLPHVLHLLFLTL